LLCLFQPTAKKRAQAVLDPPFNDGEYMPFNDKLFGGEKKDFFLTGKMFAASGEQI